MPLLESANRASNTDKASSLKRLKRLSRVPSRATTIIEQANADADAPVQWPPTIRDALRVLTYKQRRLVIGIASGMPRIQAYKAAYDVSETRSDDTVAAEASTACSNQKVAHSIDLILDWVDREWLFDSKDAVETHILRLDEESQHASKASDRIAASVAILKAHGAFVSRSEVKHIHTVDSPMADLIEGLSSMLGLAQPVPKTPAQIEAADVASVEFVEPE